MQDLIASGAAWFESQRRQHLAYSVEYRPAVGLTRTVRATLLVGNWESMDAAGQIVRTQTRDWLIHVDDLAQDPKRGDVISATVDGVETLYEVAVPAGAQNHWRWNDRLQRIRRVHTQTKSGASAVANVSLLVRAIGVHSSAAITDAQIKSDLTLDLGTTRASSKTLAPASQYVYVVLPDSFGTPTLRVNGFLVTAWSTTSRSITFDGQDARAYTIYRSTYAVTGSVLVEVT